MFATYTQLAPGAKHQLTLFVDGEASLKADGWYTLAVPHQAGVEPTPTHISLDTSEWLEVHSREGHAAR